MSEAALIITSVTGVLTTVGGGFAFLINKIVSSSKEAVSQLQDTIKVKDDIIAKKEQEVELWRSRAYESGWRADK